MRKLTLSSALLGAAFIISAVRSAVAAEHVIGGPMPGYPAMRAAHIWVQASGPADVVIDYWRIDKPEAHLQTDPVELPVTSDYAGTVTIDELEPGTAYGYQVDLDGKPQTVGQGPLTFRTTPLWQSRVDPPPFTVAVGSGAFIADEAFDRPGEPYGGGYEIFDRIAALKPDLMVWMGNSLYFREADQDSAAGMNARYRQVRSFPALQNLLHGTQHVAIWDEHDYGSSDSNSSFPLKASALELFRRYWANPAYGMPDAPGIYTVVSYGDADFFLLDDRWYRDSDRGPADSGRTMFGVAQLHWLRNALLASPATFRLIVSGGQLLDDQPPFAGWSNFPEERRNFLDWLKRARIPGVMFLSGNRNLTRLLKQPRNAAYPLYELTCSPLTAIARPSKLEKSDPLQVDGTLIGERNFCALQFLGPPHDRRIKVQVHATSGEVLWQREISAAELR